MTPERPLRIAFFTDVFPRISNTFIINQITGLIDRGHDVRIFARATGDFQRAHEQVRTYRLDERMSHIPIPRHPLRRIATAAGHLGSPRAWHPATASAFDIRRHRISAVNLLQLYTTLSFLRDPDFDVVHVQFGKLAPALLPLLRSGALRAPLVVAFRGADISSAVHKNPHLYDELFRWGTLYLPVSDFFRRRLESLGAPPERISVLHSGIELDRFPFGRRERAEGEPTRVLFVGRLTEKKGITYAIEAVAKAAAGGRDVELTVIGTGEQEGLARERAEQLGISGRVRWEGARRSDEVARRLSESHLLIAPCVTASDGDQEGIPNVLKEAMATGLPVLSTHHSGIPELVEHGVSGYLVPERDADALAAALVELVDRPHLWPAMGAAGRAKVEKEFDSDQLNDRLVTLYRSLARPPVTPAATAVPTLG